MSKVVRVKDGNYKIVVDNPGDASGGLITLDTTGGYTTDRGKVVITGDLEVKGITTTVESTVTSIADNIITLNEGQTGAGISAALGFQAGIGIDRGSLPEARLLFDESIPFVTGGSSGNGSFVFENAAGQYLPVSFNSLNAQGTLYITTPGSAINVAGTVDYEENVFTYSGGVIVDGGSGVVINNDFIPNTKGVVDYVNYALATNLQAAIEQGDTRFATEDDSITSIESRIKATVDGVIIANFYSNRLEVADIKIQENEISTTASNTDLVLSSPGTGTVKIKDVLEITETPGDDDILNDPSLPVEGVKIYSKTQAEGGTGVYFVNKNNTSDEFISRNRSLVFSMLF
jgi:hypothetical protein